MGALLAMGLAYIIANNLEDLSSYKEPKGKHKNRYK